MYKKQKVTEIFPHQFHGNCAAWRRYFIFWSINKATFDIKIAGTFSTGTQPPQLGAI